MSEVVDPQTGTSQVNPRRARLLVCDDDGQVFTAKHLPPDVAAARRRYLAGFSGRMNDARQSGAVEFDGGPAIDGIHIIGRPWYDFERSLGPGGAPRLPACDLDGLPVDHPRERDEDEP